MIEARKRNICDGLSFGQDVLTHPCNDWHDADREFGDPLRLGFPSSIYALLDPDSKEVRYVGTAANMRQRGKCHATSDVDGSRPLENWLRRLRLRGKQPHIIEICRVSGARFVQGRHIGVLESLYIRFMAHYCGRRLLNRKSNPLWVQSISKRGKRIFLPRHKDKAVWLFPIGLKQLDICDNE